MSVSLTSGHTPRYAFTAERVPINIAPEVRERLRAVLYQPEMRAVGYSAFIDRACEAAETEIAELRNRSVAGTEPLSPLDRREAAFRSNRADRKDDR